MFISTDDDFTTTQRVASNFIRNFEEMVDSSRLGKTVSEYKARVASRRSVNMFGRKYDALWILRGSLI